MKGLGNLAIAMLVLGIVMITAIPQEVMAVDSGTVVKQIGANETNGSQYLKQVAGRIQIILGIIGGVIIAVMWLWIGIEYHMANQQRREELKEKMLWALIGSLIIVMAVGGIFWMLARWVAGV